jgi:hypothetical protein
MVKAIFAILTIFTLPIVICATFQNVVEHVSLVFQNSFQMVPF